MISAQTLIILIILIAGAAGLIIYVLTSQLKNIQKNMQENEDEKVLMEWLKDMKGSVEKNSETLERQLNEQRKTLQEQLNSQRDAISKQTKVIWERLENSSKVISQVHKELGGITEFGKDMKDLSNILKSPKLRGGLGEQFLYEILENSLPKDLFKTQYKFKEGAVADAVIKTDKGLIPIDSKFPMENFKAMLTNESQDERDKIKKVFVRDVKKRIDEISTKYILPAEGTAEFAVMYVPSENVYYELVVNTPEIEAYAKEKNVFITSPNTLSYQVKAILVAYQQTELHKHTGEILKSLSGILVEARKFDDDLGTLERHITHTYKAMDGVKSNFAKLFGKIESVQSLSEVTEKEQELLE